jgi:hypothetical protein
MRLLLDECIDEHLRLPFPDRDCRTAVSRVAALKEGGRFIDGNILYRLIPRHKCGTDVRLRCGGSVLGRLVNLVDNHRGPVALFRPEPKTN